MLFIPSSSTASLLLVTILLLSAHGKAEENCGQIEQPQGNDTNLSSANWPWLVSLFYYFNGQYFCSGTLISEKHVLSAAHCFSGSNFSTPHQQVFVVLGRVDFTQISPFEQIKNVSSIQLHPNFKKLNGNYDSNVAVLTLYDSIAFTHFVHPICLPSKSQKPFSGSIVGYKKSQKSKTVEFFAAPVVNITSCLFGDENSCKIYGDDFSCSSVSGSGFYGQSGATYRISGIFSKGMDDADDELCGLNNFVVFTFVDLYVEWIVGVMNAPFKGEKRSGKELKESSEIFCDFRWNYDQSNPIYTCIIRGLNIPSPYTTSPIPIKGIHGDDDSDSDITRIHITKSKAIFLPGTTGLVHKFQNVQNFWVSKSNLKFVERVKLQPLSNLTTLCLNENDIEEFPDDAFVDLVNLEILWIYSNKVTDLSENLLRNLKQLKIFDARNNLLTFLPSKLFAENQALKVVNLSFNSLKKVGIDFAAFKGLKWIVMDGNECTKASYCKNFDCLKSIRQFQEVIDRNCGI